MNRLIEKLSDGINAGHLQLCEVQRQKRNHDDFFRKITNYKKLTIMSEFRTLSKLIDAKGDLVLDLVDYD
ncbi:MAG: hypothetical protein FWF59_09485 [Turicibacter sp.]|nr:hypothetical protein [Turicibacter sp.]